MGKKEKSGGCGGYCFNWRVLTMIKCYCLGEHYREGDVKDLKENEDK